MYIIFYYVKQTLGGESVHSFKSSELSFLFSFDILLNFLLSASCMNEALSTGCFFFNGGNDFLFIGVPPGDLLVLTKYKFAFLYCYKDFKYINCN